MRCFSARFEVEMPPGQPGGIFRCPVELRRRGGDERRRLRGGEPSSNGKPEDAEREHRHEHHVAAMAQQLQAVAVVARVRDRGKARDEQPEPRGLAQVEIGEVAALPMQPRE